MNQAKDIEAYVKKALDSALCSCAKLEQSLTVSNPVGSATNGKVYPKDTKMNYRPQQEPINEKRVSV